MKSIFLISAGIIMLGVGLYYNIAPQTMLSGATIEVTEWTIAFARTSGIFIGCFGLLSLLTCKADHSPTMQAIFLVTALMLILTSALDLMIRLHDTEVKNTSSIILRSILATGYLYFFTKRK